MLVTLRDQRVKEQIGKGTRDVWSKEIAISSFKIPRLCHIQK